MVEKMENLETEYRRTLEEAVAWLTWHVEGPNGESPKYGPRELLYRFRKRLFGLNESKAVEGQ